MAVGTGLDSGLNSGLNSVWDTKVQMAIFSIGAAHAQCRPSLPTEAKIVFKYK